jgi:hypothetical protein
MGLSLVFSAVGLFVYGYMLHKLASPEVASFFHGISLFGIIIGTITTAEYALDAYRDMANEIFIMAMVFKNFMFYGISWYVNNWIAEKGPEQMFFVIGGISIFVVSCSDGSC